jgi:hypothetical protein
MYRLAFLDLASGFCMRITRSSRAVVEAAFWKQGREGDTLQLRPYYNPYTLYNPYFS